MTGFDEFFKGPQNGTRVIGTYLYPLCLFGTFGASGTLDHTDPYTATEVVSRISSGTKEILVTRMSGLFVQPPEELSDPYQGASIEETIADHQQKLKFEEEAAVAFNHVICELALQGIVSAPASPVHISYGKLIDDHVLITSGSGGREIYLERTSAPALALLKGEWLSWHTVPEAVLDQVADLTSAQKLAQISSSLPTFLAGAYSSYSQRQLGEAIVDSWVVTEQIIDYLWTTYVREIEGGGRKKLLRDGRSYTANVRAEVLLTAGRIERDLYDQFQEARQHRNNLLHRANINLSAANASMMAMKTVVELVCERDVAPPYDNRGINW